MKKIIIPATAAHSNAASFFTEFISANKEAQASFSFRYIANKLKWPVGYISDVMAGRKIFTLLRAIQFSEYYKLRSVDKERLTWFALVENENQEVKAFFLKKLTLAPEDVLIPEIKINDSSLYNPLCVICDFLIMKQELLGPEEILNSLKLSYLTLEKVKKCLGEIVKNRYLVFSQDGKLIENHVNFSFDNYSSNKELPPTFHNINLHTEPTQNFLEFINAPEAPSTYHTGTIQVRKDQFMSIALQIVALRNWLLDISKDNIETANDEHAHRLMQFDMNLFPVTGLHKKA